MVYMYMPFIILEGSGRLLNIGNDMNNAHLLLCLSGLGQQPLTQPCELEPHGTGIHLTPPSTAQLQGATQPGQVSGLLLEECSKFWGTAEWDYKSQCRGCNLCSYRRLRLISVCAYKCKW